MLAFPPLVRPAPSLSLFFPTLSSPDARTVRVETRRAAEGRRAVCVGGRRCGGGGGGEKGRETRGQREKLSERLACIAARPTPRPFHPSSNSPRPGPARPVGVADGRERVVEACIVCGGWFCFWVRCVVLDEKEKRSRCGRMLWQRFSSLSPFSFSPPHFLLSDSDCDRGLCVGGFTQRARRHLPAPHPTPRPFEPASPPPPPRPLPLRT